MPYAEKFSPILTILIPQETMQKFTIETDEDGNIKSWVMNQSSSQTDRNSQDDSDDSNTGHDGETSNNQDISSNS